MTPLHPSFRALVSRNIPQLDHHDLERYESLVALRHHLILEEDLKTPEKISQHDDDDDHDHGHGSSGKPRGQSHDPNPPGQAPRPKLTGLIFDVNKQANDIVRPFRKEYEAVVRLWNARRRVAVQQSHYRQIPDTPQRFQKLLRAHANHQWVRLVTFPVFLKNRIKFYLESLSLKGILAVLVLTTLLGLGLRALLSPEQKSPTNTDTGAPADSTVQSQPAPVDSLK